MSMVLPKHRCGPLCRRGLLPAALALALFLAIPAGAQYRLSTDQAWPSAHDDVRGSVPADTLSERGDAGRDIAATSLIMAPTGRSLPGGSAVVGLATPYIPYVAVGVLDNLQLSAGGIYLFSTDGNTGEQYYSYAMLKHTLFDQDNASLAVGGALLFWGQEYRLGNRYNWDRAVIPGAFAVTSMGTEESKFTLGLGLANMVEGYSLGFDGGLVMGVGMGYESWISASWKFLTEHLMDVLGGGTLHTLGLRYVTGRASFDLGLIVVPNADVTISGTRIPLALPLLGVSILIG
ncbi:MAG TPA: hypothetical protein PK916_17825 [Bacteroidota bacterium]|nr:hypothetical protein [Bacteroidota bacterium]